MQTKEEEKDDNAFAKHAFDMRLSESEGKEKQRQKTVMRKKDRCVLMMRYEGWFYIWWLKTFQDRGGSKTL